VVWGWGGVLAGMAFFFLRLASKTLNTSEVPIRYPPMKNFRDASGNFFLVYIEDLNNFLQRTTLLTAEINRRQRVICHLTVIDSYDGNFDAVASYVPLILMTVISTL
jgi:hypothetical protein